jgi:penicillin-binding protein 1A
MKLSPGPEDRLSVSRETTSSPDKESNKKKPPRSPQKRFGGLSKWLFIAGIWGLFVGGILVLWFTYDLPDITKLQQTERRPSLTILAKDGTKLATYGDLHGEMVTVTNLPPHVTQALLAIEDRRFYSHFGVDIIGLLRAIWVNSRAGHVVQGGSTLTQQLAKNFLQSEKLYPIHDRSLRRKIQEALLALWLEHKFTKDQILTIYLNRVYFGSGTYGLAAASYHYFGKNPKNLSLYESAVIAGLLKAPSKYSPSTNPDLADQRAAQVLENMVKEGHISEGLKDASLVLASSTSPTFRGSAIRYFTDWIADLVQVQNKFTDKDLVVTTTLDPSLQRLAESAVAQTMVEKGESAKVSELSLVSMTYDGAIQALVGGTNYRKSQFNRATQALRQPGSAFKVILYLAALEAGLSPHDYVSDLPIRFGKWAPRNYKYQARGEISLEEAVAYSVNTVSVRLAYRLGIPQIVATARRLGIKAALPDDLTIVLGTGETTLLELTTAYAIIANNGLSVTPYAILKITDLEGHPLYTYQPPLPQHVVNPFVAHSLVQMLRAVFVYGTGQKAAVSGFCAGKTGTSQRHRDSWLMGFTPYLITGTWAGNDNNTPMKSEAGSPAARLWHLYMSGTPQGNPPSPPPQETEEPSGGLLENLLDSLL